MSKRQYDEAYVQEILTAIAERGVKIEDRAALDAFCRVDLAAGYQAEVDEAAKRLLNQEIRK